MDVATPSDFGGPKGVWTPEDLLVAAVNSCVMTTFLYHQAKSNFLLREYESSAKGRLAYGEDGLKLEEITLRPVIVVGAETDVQKARETIEQAEEGCLISRTLDCNVIVESTVEIKR
ncbi:MAG: OsmC family protein [Planctomycetota bacterium]